MRQYRFRSRRVGIRERKACIAGPYGRARGFVGCLRSDLGDYPFSVADLGSITPVSIIDSLCRE